MSTEKKSGLDEVIELEVNHPAPFYFVSSSDYHIQTRLFLGNHSIT